MTKPTRADTGGQRYLDLQKLARETGRRTDELFQLYALEGFLERMSRSGLVDQLVLKGGVLLAAFDSRRPTRDIDFVAQAFDSDIESVRDAAVQIASVEIDDGIEFDTSSATAQVIREGHDYSGVRVEMAARLSKAKLTFHVDVNVGDPISPPPRVLELPRLLGGTIQVRGYSIEMVIAEKLVTALERGVANTRWRDFVDLANLISKHDLDGDIVSESVSVVAEYRSVTLSPLSERLQRFHQVGQGKWAAWLRKSSIDMPSLQDVVSDISDFADPVFAGHVVDQKWSSAKRTWG